MDYRFNSRVYSEGLGFKQYRFYIDKFTGSVWIYTLDYGLELKILDRDESGYHVCKEALASFPIGIIKKAEKWIAKSTLDLFLPFDTYEKLKAFIDKEDPHKYRLDDKGKLTRVKQFKNRNDVIDLRDQIYHPPPKKREKPRYKPNYSGVKRNI